ncbi:MAG: hypothetical protein NTU98_08075 [Bacteroidetes bacterium]|nr:hypothetical protein [Bacteroidota bacterium]
MKNIVIMVCSDFEWDYVIDHFKPEKLTQTPYGVWFINEHQSNEKRQVKWFHGGWGKIASSGSTQYAIDKWQPELIINIGTCGGFKGKIEKDQVILIDRTVVYDMIDLFGESGNSLKKFKTAINLDWLMDETIKNQPKALMVTADQDLAPERITELYNKYGAIVGDWESGAIAWVAARNGQRLLILRGVSDLVGLDGGDIYGKPEPIVREGVKSVMQNLIKIIEKFIRAIE